MASLTPAERARIYKERAAAAGLGKPPAAGGDPRDRGARSRRVQTDRRQSRNARHRVLARRLPAL